MQVLCIYLNKIIVLIGNTANAVSGTTIIARLKWKRITSVRRYMRT